jgi:glyoxylase-like metal-dependent hydrolase (beta-lactamase superfamily II)
VAAARKITGKIYQIAGPEITAPYDCAVYLVNTGEQYLIDAGSGFHFRATVENIQAIGFDPLRLSMALLTHCHYDHIGAAPLFREHLGTPLVMHEKDAAIVARGDSRLTAAVCFNIRFAPFPVDHKLAGPKGEISLTAGTLSWLHTPGHTPGSIAPYLDIDGERILFGQDISAPLLEAYDCDPVAWETSIGALMALEADIFCDGHSGAIKGKRKVKAYLQAVVAARQPKA